MPKIRKKTSNRATTNKRARIKSKVRESHKKSKKAAKKNVQWKSKHKKDLGIPSNFPYKDQILAEIVEERRLSIEAKQKKKEVKKPVPEEQSMEVKVVGADATDEAVDITNAVFDGVSSVRGQARSRSKGKVVAREEEEEDDDIPILFNRDYSDLKSVLDKADVVVHVLDAKDPLSHRSAHLEELVSAQPGKRFLFVLNKIDTCPREAVSAWLSNLRKHYPTFPFRSASAFIPATSDTPAPGKGKAKQRADDALGQESILACLAMYAKDAVGEEPLLVAVVGLTNSGKTSFVNSLLGKPALPIYNLASPSIGPTTTALPQEVKVTLARGTQIRVVDTPGLMWQRVHTPTPHAEINSEALRARDILLRSKGRIDKLKDPVHAVTQIVTHAEQQALMLLYNLPAFTKGDTAAFLSSVARSKGFIRKHGLLDQSAAARLVLRDWSRGRFPWYTTPPPCAPSSDAEDWRLDKDEDVLAALRTKKEMRRETTGLVEFDWGAVDKRRIEIEEPWVGADEQEDEDQHEEQQVEGNAQEEDEQEDEEQDSPGDEFAEDDEMDESPAPIIASRMKRKRAREEMPSPPTPKKKVVFAADPKGTKQARRGRTRR